MLDVPHRRAVTENAWPAAFTASLIAFLGSFVYLAIAMSPRWNPPVDLRAGSDHRYWQIISTPPALWNAATTTVVILLFIWMCRARHV